MDYKTYFRMKSLEKRVGELEEILERTLTSFQDVLNYLVQQKELGVFKKKAR